MKKLIAVALCATLTTVAFAQTVLGTMKNQGDGKIVLLDEPCQRLNTSGQRRAFFYTADNYSDDGCWRVDTGTVIIEWDNFGKRRYPVDLIKEQPRIFGSVFRN